MSDGTRHGTENMAFDGGPMPYYSGNKRGGQTVSDATPQLNLYGEDLFGDPIEVAAPNKLSETFGVPPFTVLNAREGWWQRRKRAWIALGIQSELGRGGNALEAQSCGVAAGSGHGGGAADGCPEQIRWGNLLNYSAAMEAYRTRTGNYGRE